MEQLQSDRQKEESSKGRECVSNPEKASELDPQ